MTGALALDLKPHVELHALDPRGGRGQVVGPRLSADAEFAGVAEGAGELEILIELASFTGRR